MTGSDSDDTKKDVNKLSGTLSIGKSLADIKKNIEQKEQNAKGQSKRHTVVEVVSKKKVKNTTEKETKLAKEAHAKVAAEDRISSNNQDSNFNNSFLSQEEQANRQRVLERSRENKTKEVISENKESLSFVGPNIVVKSVEVDEVLAKEEGLKREKKDFTPKVQAPVKPFAEKDVAEETEEEINAKKRALVKKKGKTDTARNWRDAYYTSNEDDENLDTEVDIVLEDVQEEQVATAVVTRPIVDISRRGKTRRDRSKKRVETGISREVNVADHQLVKDLAHKMAEKSRIVLETLRKLGVEADEDTSIDADIAELLVNELGHIAKRVSEKNKIEAIYSVEDKAEDLSPRPPVVTIMGHVDHGKTSLLDYIRKTNVVSKESGGITQHIGAYQITLDGDVKSEAKKITFLDTPGHEAFTEMRARGALVTDIVILVVAGDDGLKPQSVEAINHAKAANVPIIVAINKMDKPDANPSKVKTELLQHNLVVEEMGGDVLCIEISAIKGTGIPSLLENILLQAELLDLKANHKRKAVGTVIEAKMEKGKGFVGSIIVQNGILRKGDIFVSGKNTGKVRLIINDLGVSLNEALPGMPVEIIGFNDEVFAGDDFLVVANEAEANKIIEFRKLEKVEINKTPNTPEDDLNHLLKTFGNDKKKLSIIVKADVHGSKEAILASIAKITHAEVEVKVVHSGIGQITESDVLLAKTAGAVIYGFNVRANNQAKTLAIREKIDFRYYAIIYDLLDDIKDVLGGLLSPKVVENITGYAEVREVFNITKVGKIAGCYVTEGLIKRAAFARVLRNSVVIHEGVLSQLKRFKDEVKEVRTGYECGIMFQNFQDIVVGDIIECFEKNMVERTL